MKPWNWSFSIGAIGCVVSLLCGGNGAGQDAGKPGGKTIVTVAKSTRDSTRKGEGDVIELNDGRLLLVYMEFSGTGSDFAKTRLVAQESADGGLTWDRHRVVTVTTTGDLNVYSDRKSVV